jgi:hypothetical protein
MCWFLGERHRSQGVKDQETARFSASWRRCRRRNGASIGVVS